MKAVVFERYGSPNVVCKVATRVKPIPKGNEVLIQVKTSAINDYDWSAVNGKPYVYRLMFGFVKPKKQILGMEYSGIVVEKGEEVTELSIGEEVYGDTSEFGFGTMAEYIAISAKAVLKKPEAISHEEAVTLPHAFCLAWQGLIDKGEIKKNQKVLINDAGGGVGALALQIAKLYNCQVTGVDNKGKLEPMRSFGFDHVIDYQSTDFTKQGIKYDLILDCKTSTSVFGYVRALSKEGKYVSVGGELPRLLKLVMWGNLLKVITKKHLMVLSLKANVGLKHAEKIYADGQLMPLIDGPYPMQKAPELIQKFGDGTHNGKIVLSIG